ncbi:MAG: Hint domain-containing protein [Ottowia sp.]|nr:Hint domain-containing protein [Ottowia sp.]
MATPTGYKAIETLKVGDIVWSKHEDNSGSVFASPITKTHTRDDQPIYKLTLLQGGKPAEMGKTSVVKKEALLVTPSHPFYVKGRGFVAAIELTQGDQLTDRQGGVIRVESISLIKEQGRTYNLTVAQGHTFFAGKFETWVHNEGNCAVHTAPLAAKLPARGKRAFEETPYEKPEVPPVKVMLRSQYGESFEDSLTETTGNVQIDRHDQSAIVALKNNPEVTQILGMDGNILYTNYSKVVAGIPSDGTVFWSEAFRDMTDKHGAPVLDAAGKKIVVSGENVARQYAVNHDGVSLEMKIDQSGIRMPSNLDVAPPYEPLIKQIQTENLRPGTPSYQSAVKNAYKKNLELKKQGLSDPAYDRAANDPVYKQEVAGANAAWDDISAALAKSSAGRVRALLSPDVINKVLAADYSGSIFAKTEYNKLKDNPAVTQLIAVDPRTYEETVLFDRSSAQPLAANSDVFLQKDKAVAVHVQPSDKPNQLGSTIPSQANTSNKNKQAAAQLPVFSSTTPHVAPTKLRAVSSRTGEGYLKIISGRVSIDSTDTRALATLKNNPKITEIVSVNRTTGQQTVIKSKEILATKKAAAVSTIAHVSTSDKNSHVPTADKQTTTPISKVTDEVRVVQRETTSVPRAKEPCCFAPGTLVATPTGYKAIETLKVGDIVWSKHEDNSGSVFASPITKTHTRDDQPIYKLTLLQGGKPAEMGKERVVKKEALLVTPSHPFYVKGRGFVAAIELTQGDQLTDRQGGIIRVASISLIKEQGRTYNLTVAQGHTFFAGKFETWVHNEGLCSSSTLVPQQSYKPASTDPVSTALNPINTEIRTLKELRQDLKDQLDQSTVSDKDAVKSQIKTLKSQIKTLKVQKELLTDVMASLVKSSHDGMSITEKQLEKNRIKESLAKLGALPKQPDAMAVTDDVTRSTFDLSTAVKKGLITENTVLKPVSEKTFQLLDIANQVNQKVRKSLPLGAGNQELDNNATDNEALVKLLILRQMAEETNTFPLTEDGEISRPYVYGAQACKVGNCGERAAIAAAIAATHHGDQIDVESVSARELTDKAQKKIAAGKAINKDNPANYEPLDHAYVVINWHGDASTRVVIDPWVLNGGAHLVEDGLFETGPRRNPDDGTVHSGVDFSYTQANRPGSALSMSRQSAMDINDLVTSVMDNLSSAQKDAFKNKAQEIIDHGSGIFHQPDALNDDNLVYQSPNGLFFFPARPDPYRKSSVGGAGTP